MKGLIQLTILISMVATPFTGYCSYRRDALELDESDFYDIEWLIESMYPKCLMLIDMVKNTKEKKKKAVLKINLEIELLKTMDAILYEIEQCKIELEYRTSRPEEAETQQQVDHWNCMIDSIQRDLESHRQNYSKIEALLKYTR